MIAGTIPMVTLGAGHYPPGHPMHPMTGLLMSMSGSAVGLASGVFTFILAQANGWPVQYAGAGILIGLASVVTAFMPAILRVINWKVEEAREDRKAREARHALASKVQVATNRLDLQDAVIRRALAHIRTADREQHAALVIYRDWMRRVADDTGTELPPDFGRRAFDDPNWRGEIDRLFQILDIDPMTITPMPPPRGAGAGDPVT